MTMKPHAGSARLPQIYEARAIVHLSMNFVAKLLYFYPDHVNKEEFIFSYEWTKGDICLWDNLSILHMASEIKNCRRVMHRITIK